MRTTIDMPDSLLRRAKQTAAQHNTTLRALVTDALERRLSEKASGFRLQDASAGGGKKRVDSKAINAAIDEQRKRPFHT